MKSRLSCHSDFRYHDMRFPKDGTFVEPYVLLLHMLPRLVMTCIGSLQSYVILHVLLYYYSSCTTVVCWCYYGTVVVPVVCVCCRAYITVGGTFIHAFATISSYVLQYTTAVLLLYLIFTLRRVCCSPAVRSIKFMSFLTCVYTDSSVIFN